MPHQISRVNLAKCIESSRKYSKDARRLVELEMCIRRVRCSMLPNTHLDAYMSHSGVHRRRWTPINK